MLMRFRFTIRDLLLLILAIALLLGAWSFIWESTRSNIYSPLSDNAGFFFSINLALLAMSTLSSSIRRPADPAVRDRLCRVRVDVSGVHTALRFWI